MVAVGFIGLGEMGLPIAKHLLKEAAVTGFDVDRDAVDPLELAGGTAADTASDAVAGSDVVFLSLPAPDIVEQVVEETIDTFDNGAVLVDLSTSMPAVTDRISDRLGERDVDVLGAPVSGGPSGAAEASLSVLVGGERAVFEACRPLFETFGTDVMHVGEKPGYGHAVKLLNNYLSFAGFLAASEAMVLGRSVGLDGERLLEAINASSGRNTATAQKFPDYVLPKTYDMGFPLKLMEKDIRLFAAFGESQDMPLLLGDVVSNLVGYARSQRGSDADMTEVYRFFEDQMERQ